MNGELNHACRLSAAVKYALAGADFSFEAYPYEQELHLLFQDEINAEGGVAWMELLRTRGLRDVVLLSPSVVEDRNLLAFSGGAQFGIACFYVDNCVTFWTANWSFDRDQSGWCITYKETLLPDAPKEKPTFDDTTPTFVMVLEDISALAERLDEQGFANCFSKAKNILLGVEQPNEQSFPLPVHHARLFAAAGSAWVFGGMCAWNDSPPYTAKKKGLEKEYERLSTALYSQIIYAVLYAVNEW